MKNKMRLQLAIMALMMAALTLQVSAQEGQRGQRSGGGPGRGFQMTEEDIKERVDNLSENLKFSQEQHKKILDYELETYNKMQIERQKMQSQGGDFDREAMRARMREMREERDKKYEEVLTKEQMVKFNEIREQRRNQMRQQYQDRDGDGQGERPQRGRGRG
jgi:hypothetical protein